MDAFEQKIYNLTQKLHNITPKPPQNNPPTPQHLLQLTTALSYNIEQKQEELQRRCVSLMQSLTLYESELNKLINRCQSDVERIGEDNASFVENIRIQRSQKREEFGKIQKKVLCEMEERIEEDKCQFEIQVKNIKKEIKKELGLLQKQIRSLNENPQLEFLSSDNRIYKDYYLKVSLIEQNQRKKAQKLNEIETKVHKRIQKMKSNISNRILFQDNQIKSKYSKLKRLFALITDIS